MPSSPLNPGSSSRRPGLNRTPTPLPQASSSKLKQAEPASFQPGQVYQQPAFARSHAGRHTPNTLSYETIPLHDSVDNLIPGKPGSSSKTSAALLGDSIEMQDMAPARKQKRHQRPLDPSIAAITLKDTPQTRDLERLAEVPHSGTIARNASTDDFGLPRPATDRTHREIKDEVLAEDSAIRSRTQKIGAAVTAAIGTVILGGAAVLTYQGAKGKI